MLINILFALLLSQNIAFASQIPNAIVTYSQEYKQDPYIVMDIISCEGGFDKIKTSPTNDVGPMQINKIHIPEAEKMGLNIYKHDDNIHYGIYLMSEKGLKPWSSSEKCWIKHPISGGQNSP